MHSTMPMIIDGRSHQASEGSWLDLVNPATEEKHARVPHASPRDVDEAVGAARRAFEEGPWSRMSPSERGKLLYELADAVEKNADQLALMDTQDMGKPYQHSRFHDVEGALAFLRFYAGFADKIRGSQVPCGPDRHVYVMREPMGVVAAIVPWNFPLAMAVQKLAPALACGNTIVLKPAEQSPRSAVCLGEKAMEVGFPPGVVNVITGLGETTGAALASHPGVDKISFTGSTEVGRQIMHAAAGQIKKVLLELGGKSANIVFPDADLDLALASTIATSCYNSGQVCTSGSRLLLHREIHDEFRDELVSRINRLKIGDPLQSETKLGPLASSQQYEKVNGYISTGRESYPHYVCGQQDADLKQGYYVRPILFDHVEPESVVAQEEIFGPVLSLIDYESEEDAIRVANQTRYGLATAIWTTDLNRAHRLAARVDSGVVWINCVKSGSVAIPLEGHRGSGMGVDGGTEVVESYTKLKSVCVDLNSDPHPWSDLGGRS